MKTVFFIGWGYARRMERKECVGEHVVQSPKKLSDMRTYIAAILMFVPSIHSQSESTYIGIPKNESRSVYEAKYRVIENNDVIASYEAIFKDGIRKSLVGLNSIDQIPVGGQKITYYWDSGSLKGKPISAETVKALGLPDKFDISPRKIDKTSVGSMYFTLGNRMFSITPDIGMIKSITLNSNALVIEISAFFGIVDEDIVYDKQNKLPDLMFRLWMSPKGKGEKKGFKSTTVKEI